ncbi:MAG: hypothetical protein CMF39_00300 [Legionellaceae bacterium]|mgnify:CR=1 FL=1|nr:hypothetical protein [Legionellaceae bacterium]
MYQNGVDEHGLESLPLFPVQPTPVKYSTIVWEFLTRSPSFILISYLRGLSTNSIFIMAALRYPDLLPSIGPISAILSSISGIVSAPSYSTGIVASNVYGKGMSVSAGNQESKVQTLQQIEVSSLRLMRKLGMMMSLLTLTAGIASTAVDGEAMNDFSIFFLLTFLSPLLSAMYNSSSQYQKGIKNENKIALINILSAASTILLCWYLTFKAALGIYATALSYLARTALNYILLLPLCYTGYQRMFAGLKTNGWGKKQWDNSIYLTLHFASEYLLPTSMSIIIRTKGKVPSSAYTFFLFFKMLISYFMYGMSESIRTISSYYYKKYPDNPELRNNASLKIAVVGSILQLIGTGAAQVIAIKHGKKFLSLLTILHESKTEVEAEQAYEIMKVFTGLLMADSLRLALSSTLNGRRDTKTPAMQSLFWTGIVIQSAIWIAGAGLQSSINTLAYLTYAGFSLNILTLAMALGSEMRNREDNESNETSLFRRACNFMSFREKAPEETPFFPDSLFQAN